MRGLLLLLFAAAGLAPAQLIEARIEFRDTGCVPCAESLQSRLERVRGVETVSLDLDAGTIEMTFAEDNQVRLIPLRARVTQDGTEILQMSIRAKGVLRQQVFTLVPSEESLSLFGDNSSHDGPAWIEGLISEKQDNGLSLQLKINSVAPPD